MTQAVEHGYRTCERLTRRHYENFSVGSLLLPRGTRRQVFSLYAFARTTDDLGDEFEGDRLEALDAWEAELRACYTRSPRHPVMIALRETIRSCHIPPEPFLKLIEANRMDQRIRRHATWRDLQVYCDHSANPCGHLILYAFRRTDPALFRLSDHICTALQLVNFWQDVAADYGKGRMYIPFEDLVRFKVREEDIATGRMTEEFRRLMAFECSRTRDLFDKGRELERRLTGAARFDVRLFARGGRRLLDLIEKSGYDVFGRRPTVSSLSKVWIGLSSLLGVLR